jgi:DNA polymerase-4
LPRPRSWFPPRFAAYAEASEQVFAILERYTPLIEPLSLDEAFLDVTASQALFGTPAEIATRMRREIAAEVRLPASAGIASSKFVAKIASDLAKPDGQREVPPEKTREFLAALPVSRLWGVGPKLEERLHRLGCAWSVTLRAARKGGSPRASATSARTSRPSLAARTSGR